MSSLSLIQPLPSPCIHLVPKSQQFYFKNVSSFAFHFYPSNVALGQSVISSPLD